LVQHVIEQRLIAHYRDAGPKRGATARQTVKPFLQY
jgi:hypothetical protein